MTPALSQKDKDGLKIIVACASIFIFMGILTVILGAKERVDEETLCLLDKPLNGHTVFFVDRTDPLNKKQTEWLLREVEKAKQELNFNEKLSIYSIIGSTDSFLRVLFSRCSPGSGKEANPLYQNPKKIQKYFEESFGGPLSKILSDLTKGTKYSTSPIMESIKNLSNQKEFSSRINNRKLYVVSDMLQNTNEFSHYHPYSLQEFEKSDYFKKVKPDLDSVEVRIYYIANNYTKARNIQNQDHSNFWLSYFKKSGAKHVEKIPISYLSIGTPVFRKKLNPRKDPVLDKLPNKNLDSIIENDATRRAYKLTEDKSKTRRANKEIEALKSAREDKLQSKINENNGGAGVVVRRNFMGLLGSNIGNKKSIIMQLCFYPAENNFRGRFKEENSESWLSLRGNQNTKYLISLTSLQNGRYQGLFTGKYDGKSEFSGEFKSSLKNETVDFRLFEQKQNASEDAWSASIEKLECVTFN